MQTKLTLRMDEELVEKAKSEAHRRGKSLSQMVGDYFNALSANEESGELYPPVTKSLLGIVKDQNLDELAYKNHLLEKHR